MGLREEIIAIIADAAPGCVAEHDRDGFDKLHSGDLKEIADRIAKHVKKHYVKKS